MQKYEMKIITNDQDNNQHRIIIEVNGIELDILADNTGINASLSTGEELTRDWD